MGWETRFGAIFQKGSFHSVKGLSAMEKSFLEVTHIAGDGHCILEEDGARVAAEVGTALRAGQSVALSFRGVEMLTTSFIRALFLPLLEQFSAGELNAQLHIADAEPGDTKRIKFVIDDLKLRLRDPEAYDRAREHALELA